MKYFVLVYNQRTGELISDEEFGEEARDEAAKARFKKELDARGQEGIEVVMLGAVSHAAIERTHARYFKTVGELAAQG